MLFTGRSLLNSVFNLGIKGEYAQALSELGYDLEVVVEQVCAWSFFFSTKSLFEVYRILLIIDSTFSLNGKHYCH